MLTRRKSIPFLCVCLLAIISSAQFATADETASQRWHQWRKNQDRFPLAVWAYFYRFEGTKAEYQTYADCNLTFVTVPQSHYDSATAAGLNVLIGGWEKLHENSDNLNKAIVFANDHSKNVIGYQLMDEPKPDSLEGITAAVKTIYEKDNTAAIQIIDLLPNWGWERNNNRVKTYSLNYIQFVEKFLDDVNPPVLLNCQYPPLLDGSDRTEYYANMELFRDLALQRNIGMMAFVSAAALKDVYRQASDSDLRWQVYTGLIYGAQGIWYWNWRIKPERIFVDGIVSYETGEPLELYPSVKTINAEALAIGDVLMKLRSVAVFHTGDDVPDGARKFPNRGDTGWSVLKNFIGEKFIIGDFKNIDDAADKDSYVMIVNKRHGAELASNHPSLQATAKFKTSAYLKHVYRYSKTNGALEEIKPNEKGFYSITLTGGEGALLRLSKAPLTQ